METEITTGQMRAFFTLLKQKGVTPERFKKVLESGVLADILDARANLRNRTKIIRVLGMFEKPKLVIAYINDIPQPRGCVIQIEEGLPLSDLDAYLTSDGFALLETKTTGEMRALCSSLLDKGVDKECRVAFCAPSRGYPATTTLIESVKPTLNGSFQTAEKFTFFEAGTQFFVTTPR